MDYINSHTTSLSTDLKLDPESRSRSRTVRPTKGGGGREGGNMWVILYMHNINSHFENKLFWYGCLYFGKYCNIIFCKKILYNVVN